MLNAQRDKKNLLLVAFLLLLLIIACTYLLSAPFHSGIPNEFTYNIPYINLQQGQFPGGDEYLRFSKHYTNPLLYLAAKIFTSFEAIYLFTTTCNLILFLLATYLLFGTTLNSLLFPLVFFGLSGTLLVTGINSSYQYSILLLGYALYNKNKIKAFYASMIVCFYLYPFSSLIALYLYGVLKLKNWKSSYRELTLLAIIFLALVFSWKIMIGAPNGNEFYETFIGWPKLLSDPYLFSDSLVTAAKSNSLSSVIAAILGDSNKIGTTLLSLTPLDTPRFIGLFIIACAIGLKRKLPFEVNKDVKLCILAILIAFTISLIMSFSFYYPHRYIRAPIFLFVSYCTLKALNVLNAERLRIKLPIYLVSAFSLLIFYFYTPIWGSWIAPSSYLSYHHPIDREDSYTQLISYMRGPDFQGTKVVASPRLASLLLLEKVPVIPIVPYKFVDRTQNLKDSTHLAWSLFLSSEEEELKEKCSQNNIDFIIFEKPLLNLLKNGEFELMNKNFPPPYPSFFTIGKLPILDYSLEQLQSFGAFSLYSCPSP